MIQNSLGNAADVEALMNGGIRTTSVFPLINSEKLFPLTKINIIFKGIETAERKEFLDKRKRIPKWAPWAVIRQVAANLVENNYEGVHAHIVPDSDKFKEVEPFSDGGRLSVNLSDPLNPLLYTREFEAFSTLSIVSGKLSGVKRWFSYSAIESVEPKKLHASIRLLEDFGLSGRRTTGSGYFKINQMESVEDSSQGFTGEGLYLLLSKYIPVSSDMDSLVLQRSMYSISTMTLVLQRSTPTKTRDLSYNRNEGTYRCFSEGSLLYLKGDVVGRSYNTGNEKFLPFFPVMRRVI
jgi:CRISPR type III-A-associated RAMP protein Csm4